MCVCVCECLHLNYWWHNHQAFSFTVFSCIWIHWNFCILHASHKNYSGPFKENTICNSRNRIWNGSTCQQWKQKKKKYSNRFTKTKKIEISETGKKRKMQKKNIQEISISWTHLRLPSYPESLTVWKYNVLFRACAYVCVYEHHFLCKYLFQWYTFSSISNSKRLFFLLIPFSSSLGLFSFFFFFFP